MFAAFLSCMFSRPWAAELQELIFFFNLFVPCSLHVLVNDEQIFADLLDAVSVGRWVYVSYGPFLRILQVILKDTTTNLRSF